MAKTKYITIELTKTELKAMASYFRSHSVLPPFLNGVVASAWRRARGRIIQADTDHNIIRGEN